MEDISAPGKNLLQTISTGCDKQYEDENITDENLANPITEIYSPIEEPSDTDTINDNEAGEQTSDSLDTSTELSLNRSTSIECVSHDDGDNTSQSQQTLSDMLSTSSECGSLTKEGTLIVSNETSGGASTQSIEASNDKVEVQPQKSVAEQNVVNRRRLYLHSREPVKYGSRARRGLRGSSASRGSLLVLGQSRYRGTSQSRDAQLLRNLENRRQQIQARESSTDISSSAETGPSGTENKQRKLGRGTCRLGSQPKGSSTPQFQNTSSMGRAIRRRTSLSDLLQPRRYSTHGYDSGLGMRTDNVLVPYRAYAPSNNTTTRAGDYKRRRISRPLLRFDLRVRYAFRLERRGFVWSSDSDECERPMMVRRRRRLCRIR